MAAPELTPVPVEPLIDMERVPLKRDSEAELCTHSVVENEEKGTISPAVFLANHDLMSSGCMRNSLSPCTITGLISPSRMKSLTLDPERATCSTALAADRSTPRA